jgi:hypothetical protein
VDAHRLLRPAELRAGGFTNDEVRQFLRDGALTPLRRGTYLLGEPPDDASARHALLVRAAMRELGAGAVTSHVSAAVLHGIPVWHIPLDRVHVTRPRRTGGRCGSRVHVHTAPLDPSELAVRAGVAVTSVARTVVDLARSVPFEEAVVVADAALAAGLVDRAELDQEVRQAQRWPGVPAARRVIGFADGRSESVGESRSRVALGRAGLPAPELQWEVWSARGLRLGRVDFWWRGSRTVGEFDGRVKYGRLLRPGQDPGEAVFQEKLREDALRDEGLHVVRWTWQDLDSFAAVVDRLRRRIA